MVVAATAFSTSDWLNFLPPSRLGLEWRPERVQYYLCPGRLWRPQRTGSRPDYKVNGTERFRLRGVTSSCMRCAKYANHRNVRLPKNDVSDRRQSPNETDALNLFVLRKAGTLYAYFTPAPFRSTTA